MIIDAHTHVYPEKIASRAVAKLEANAKMKAQSDGRKEGLKASMKTAGVDYSILMPVATSPRQVDKINEEAGEANAEALLTGLFSFGGIHPDTQNYKETLTKVRNLGLKGIKIHPDYQEAFFNDIRYKRIVEEATNQGLYIMVHAGEDIGLPSPIHCRPEHILEVLKDTKTDKLILAHMGGWRLWDEVMDRLVGQNVYFDTAFSTDNIKGIAGLLSEEAFIRLIHAHGADRILFGTDSPWSEQKNCVDWMKKIALTAEEKEMIFSKNVRKLLGI